MEQDVRNTLETLLNNLNYYGTRKDTQASA